jgi:hypothetical protein
VTANNNCNGVTDKHLVGHRNSVNNINSDLQAQEQQCSYLCDQCGFIPCICKYILELDAETGLWIVDDLGELYR